MNSTDGLAKTFKTKFKKFLNQENLLPETPNTSTNGKNVSWAEYYEYDVDSKQKKPLRSTPYPNRLKKMKISNSTPKALAFDDSDTENNFLKESSYTTFEDISKLCEPKNQGTKRNRTFTAWTVTSCNKIKPDKSNKRCNVENITASSESDNADSPEDETVQDEVENEMGKSANENERNLDNITKRSRINFKCSSSEDEYSDSNAEKVFKPKFLNLNRCQIIKPTVEINSDDNAMEEDISKDNIENISYEQSNTTSKTETSNDDNYIENEVERPLIPKIRFSKVVRTFINETHCILFLKHPLKLYFNGKLSISVLFGAVEILGHVLNNDKQKQFEIYSPRGHSYVCFETTNGTNNTSKETLQNVLSIRGMPTKQIKEFLYHLGEHDCVITIQNLNNNITNYLSTHVAQYLFPKPIQCEKKIEKKLHCLFEIENPLWKVYKKNEEWAKCVETTFDNLTQLGFSSTMLCGGKAVGKSTLCRYMINSLLNKVEKVVCIDLDPGQAEFTIGGCVSVTIVEKPIFGPNFTHFRTPTKSFFVGDVNVVNCIDRYINSVKELLMYCERHIDKKYPWIINYIGFTKSLGTDLTTTIIKLVIPTAVVQINSSMKTRNYQSALTVDYIQNYVYSFPIITPQAKLTYDLIVLNSYAEEKVEGEFQYEARHLREMSILSYFSQIADGTEITSMPPYGVKLSSVKLHDLGYSGENIPAVLNGNLVALCNTKDETINDQTAFDCFGFGIIRGIDLDTEELYLLTPIPETELDNVNSLIRGNINLPPSLYMTIGRQGLVPYILLGTQQGTSSIPKRSYRNLKMLLANK